MASLLFLMFFVTMALALMNKEKLSFIAFGLSIAASLFWFHHHATSTLNIQL
ncbi:DUF5993 family protein [Sneathiella marina]|uniref:DUF5993 family protein n=1 Tax=Sneathiella marina TaxID=2950108 RepID=A0ABY4W3U0_9PROT|nr:DUF5993 family protein [Sneathiella marina]USG61851.1 DUF5993 family protein [Sneathiella marina]